MPTALAGTPGGPTVSATATVSPGGTYFIANGCQLLTRVVPSGGSPVTGSVTSRVTIDASVQSYNGSPYVQRHYDVEPATSPATATATITLYYTQAEFDNYNAANGSNPDLPTGPGDVAGKFYLRLTQYHGTGTAPGNYTGSVEFIDPADGNIIWNSTASRWEVTFDVTGFSGFYLHTGFGVLPVNLVSFTGVNQGSYNKIQWITSEEVNSDYFDLERSTDGINFSTTATIRSQNSGSSSNKHYAYNDLRGNSPTYFYRLKMVDNDGSFSYSLIIRISTKQNNLVSVYPNPAQDKITVSASDTKLLNTDIEA